MPGRQSKRVAQGANVLRGGRRNFQHHTLIGNWQEDREIVPAPLKYERPGFETTKGLGEMEATQTRARRYGQGIATGTVHIPSNIIHYQKEDLQDKFRSIATLAHKDMKTFQSLYGAKFKLGPCKVVPPSELAEYRRKWCRDSTREKRFVTDNTENHNRAVEQQFKVAMVGSHPNYPLILKEILREISQGGSSVALRKLPLSVEERFDKLESLFQVLDDDDSGHLSRNVFRTALADYGVNIKDEKFDAIWKYFDPHQAGSLPYGAFMQLLRESRDPLELLTHSAA